MLYSSVSYNQDVYKADAEVEELEKDGYLVVETYWYDWDCGQRLMKCENDSEIQEVFKLNREHIERCNEQRELHKELGLY